MNEFREAAPAYRTGKYTYQDYAKLPEGARYQLIGGELVVAPSPTDFHQGISTNIFRLMDAFVLAKDVGTVRYAPLDVQLNDKEIYQPDLLFMTWSTVERIRKERINGAPDLVGEILSRSTSYHDLTTRLRNYERYGVGECWIVDPRDRSVEVFVREGRGFLPARRVEGSGTVESVVLAGFTITIAQVFHYPRPGTSTGYFIDEEPGEFREALQPYRTGEYTSQEYAGLPVGTPRQFICGELIVTLPPTDAHQTVSANLTQLMSGFVRENGLGTVRTVPVEVALDDKNIYRPDVVFIAADRMDVVEDENVAGAPDLVVEVISPDTFYYDTRPKLRNYGKYGVREYWIVDPEIRSVEIRVLEGGKLLPARREEGNGTVESEVLAGLTVSLEDIFA